MNNLFKRLKILLFKFIMKTKNFQSNLKKNSYKILFFKKKINKNIFFIIIKIFLLFGSNKDLLTFLEAIKNLYYFVYYF